MSLVELPKCNILCLPSELNSGPGLAAIGQTFLMSQTSQTAFVLNCLGWCLFVVIDIRCFVINSLFCVRFLRSFYVKFAGNIVSVKFVTFRMFAFGWPWSYDLRAYSHRQEISM